MATLKVVSGSVLNKKLKEPFLRGPPAKQENIKIIESSEKKNEQRLGAYISIALKIPPAEEKNAQRGEAKKPGKVVTSGYNS